MKILGVLFFIAEWIMIVLTAPLTLTLGLALVLCTYLLTWRHSSQRPVAGTEWPDRGMSAEWLGA